MPAPDLKAYLHQTIHTVADFFVKDLKALPEAALAAPTDGASRSPLDVAGECAGVNARVTALLSDGPAESPSDEQRAAFRARFDTRETAIALFEESIQKLLSAIAALDEGALGEMTTHPFGHQDTVFSAAMLPALHLMYHDGQFNYVQRMHGDKEMHWR